MKTINLFILSLLLFNTNINGQHIIADTIQKKENWKKFIVPTALTGTALLLNNSKLEKDLQEKLGGHAFTNIDDYTRFLPAAQMYIADIAGVTSQNHWFDQTKNLGISLLLTDLVTTRFKRSIDKKRPSGSNNNAFPSAHSSYAFTTATVIYEEYKDSNRIFAYSGYGFAIATAGLRVAKNAHFVSDVLLGAGIGIGIVKMVYLLDHLLAWNPFLKMDNVVIVPSVGYKSYGLASRIIF
ncbi:MAG: hypothetical protein CL868_00270 [Cytophagaceae bacterium]|nr:hypothetical protein [Cytophagaceae bacterium]|tara:strand:- start:10394 stop:11110 length:717 start_codon:yes stop_codon:yes gene_type:complete